MEYKVVLDKFEGPLDLLLHLIKDSNIDIVDINIEEITKQYLDFINKMEQLNLNIASEYLVMAAELIEMKSSILLPRPTVNETDEYIEDPRKQLIERLLEYKRYKELVNDFKDLEEVRKEYYTKEPSDLRMFQEKKPDNQGDINDLMVAFSKFLERKNLEKPVATKITKKEYSVGNRSIEIKKLISIKKRVEFTELFDILSKDYVVVTFLSILDLAKKQDVLIEQEDNFNKIFLVSKGSV